MFIKKSNESNIKELMKARGMLIREESRLILWWLTSAFARGKGGWRSPRERCVWESRSSQHSSDRPVNIAKLKARNLWAVWGPGAIPWIMAPLTRLELRRAAAKPILLRLLRSLSRSLLSSRSPSPLLSHPLSALLSSKCEVVSRASWFSDTYFRRGTFARISNMKCWSALNLFLPLSPSLLFLFICPLFFHAHPFIIRTT